MADVDPLQLKALALRYDYLMYKIHDRIAALAEATHRAVAAKARLVEHDYLQRQLRLDAELAAADALLAETARLDVLFAQLDQLYAFAGDFAARLRRLEAELQGL